MPDPDPALRPPALFRFCPRCGRGPVEPGQGPVFGCPGCGLHYHFNPTTAAGIVVEDEEGRVLFVRRAHEPARGRLAVPGGFVDVNEAAEEAARRETREETGLEVDEIAFLGSWPNAYEYRGVVYPVLDLYFTGRARAGSTALPGHEAEEILWRRPAEVDSAELAFPTTRAAIARFRATRGRGDG